MQRETMGKTITVEPMVFPKTKTSLQYAGWGGWGGGVLIHSLGNNRSMRTRVTYLLFET